MDLLSRVPVDLDVGVTPTYVRAEVRKVGLHVVPAAVDESGCIAGAVRGGGRRRAEALGLRQCEQISVRRSCPASTEKLFEPEKNFCLASGNRVEPGHVFRFRDSGSSCSFGFRCRKWSFFETLDNTTFNLIIH